MILNDRNSVNVAAFSNKAGGLQATITLWYTTDGSLPSCAANNSLVATIGATGVPATFHGNWTQVPRSGLGNATFTIGASPTTTNFNNYGFNGWDLQGIAATNTATFFAIVVGTGSLPATNVVNIDSISLVPGDIPTRPAPDTPATAVLKCQRYFEMSFPIGTIPASNNAGTGAYAYGLTSTAVNSPAPTVVFVVDKVSLPTITFYDPYSAGAQAYDGNTLSACTATAAPSLSTKFFAMTCTPPALSSVGDTIFYQFTADARLGV